MKLMLLIGMFDSPFVRRVGISMKLLGIPFEHANWSVGKDAARIRRYNPLGRVPTLVLDDGEALVESTMILDYLDERVGAERALLLQSGPARRQVQKLCALALGAGEKARDLVYEDIMRPAEKRHLPWQERCHLQLTAALAELERAGAGVAAPRWLAGERLSQADVTVACMFTVMCDSPPVRVQADGYPRLAAHVARCEALPEFRAVKAPWFAFAPTPAAG